MTHIESRPEVLGGQYVLKGTQFSVAQMLAEVADEIDAFMLQDDLNIPNDLSCNALHELAKAFEENRVVIVSQETRDYANKLTEEYRLQTNLVASWMMTNPEKKEPPCVQQSPAS